MAQFLLITTLLSIAGLVATSIMGFTAAPGHHAQHIFFALGTVVLGLFSQSMTMFFFIGTGKEIKDAAKNDAAVVQRTKDFKARVFPAAFYAMLVLMVTFIMGGGVAGGKTPRWLHLTLSLATLVMYARAYWVQLQAMHENAGLMEKYLADDAQAR
jgi:amino acid transporter